MGWQPPAHSAASTNSRALWTTGSNMWSISSWWTASQANNCSPDRRFCYDQQAIAEHSVSRWKGVVKILLKHYRVDSTAQNKRELRSRPEHEALFGAPPQDVHRTAVSSCSSSSTQVKFVPTCCHCGRKYRPCTDVQVWQEHCVSLVSQESTPPASMSELFKSKGQV